MHSAYRADHKLSNWSGAGLVGLKRLAPDSRRLHCQNRLLTHGDMVTSDAMIGDLRVSAVIQIIRNCRIEVQTPGTSTVMPITALRLPVLSE